MAISTIKAMVQETGTTNFDRITWNRYGNIVSVHVNALASTSGSSQAVTGLPTPKGSKYTSVPLFYSNYVGALEYLGGAWAVKTSGIGYGSISYICE